MIQTETELREELRQQKQAMIDMESKMNARLAAMETEWEEKMQKYNNALREDKLLLGHAEICFIACKLDGLTAAYTDVYTRSYPINTTSLLILEGRNNYTNETYAKIQYFYQLLDLTFENCNNNRPPILASSDTVKILTIINSPLFCTFEFIKNFPQLEDLTIQGIEISTYAVSTMRLIKHNIKTLTFNNCTGNINITEMQAYCTQNNIQLCL